VEVTTDGDPVALAEALGHMTDVMRAEPGEGRARVFFRGSHGIVPRVVAAAEAGGFHVTDLSVSEPTLETVFITLTGKDLRE
jgi:ABC-2 type transport system ATP-binding protein